MRIKEVFEQFFISIGILVLKEVIEIDEDLELDFEEEEIIA